MIKPFIAFMIAATFITTGCDLSSSSASDLVDDINEEVERREVASSNNSSSNENRSSSPPSSGAVSIGAGGFLWKPVSESTGNLVVLLPASTRGRTQQVATISGAFGSESAGMRHEHHNGGRPHFYFSRPGAAYGTNITVQAPLTDGSVFSIVVPNGAARTE